MGYSRSRAKCVPLQYPSSATRGVKQALYVSKISVNSNLYNIVSTSLQEKKNTSNKNLNTIDEEIKDQVSQSESGMYYELLNRRKMECEKYQDCSWFQQNSEKLDCKNTMSLAENFNSFIDADEFNMSMQSAAAHISPWEDEYLEVFSDNILEENYKLREKKNLVHKSNAYLYENYRGDNLDSYSVDFGLKKSDSMDSIKNISLTNPYEVIPITYKEKLNNPDYGVTELSKVKDEIKQELHSPESNLHIIGSDHNDLNIGREEEIEELNTTENFQVVKKNEKNLGEFKFENKCNEVPSDYVVNQKICKIKRNSDENNYNKVPLPIKTENGSSKLDLNLDIAKLSFEQSLNMSTPDLDFMDLVDFINEEIHQDCNAADSNSALKNVITQKKDTSEDVSTTNHLCDIEIQPNQEPSEKAPSQDQPFLKLSEFLNSANDVKNSSSVDFDAISGSCVSIAERIKTNAKRRTRKNLRDVLNSEDDEDRESSNEDYDGDEDYDYREDLVKRRSSPTKRRTKSSSVEINLGNKREEIESYREKRDKNNEASRRSRQNRKARERHMYETLEEEERRNVKLKAEANILEKQVASLRQLLLQVVLRKGGAT